MKTTSIIIPNLNNDGSDNAAVIKNAISHMVDLNGGATTWGAKGFWKNDEGKLYADDVTVIQSASTLEDAAEIDALAAAVLEATDQEAVYYDFDGQATIKNR